MSRAYADTVSRLGLAFGEHFSTFSAADKDAVCPSIKIRID